MEDEGNNGAMLESTTIKEIELKGAKTMSMAIEDVPKRQKRR
jgi:hypothetical protein